MNASKLNRSRLLGFLSKPRFESEVAAHFKLSEKVVRFHLEEEVRAGVVLVSEKPLHPIFSNEKTKPKQLRRYLYVSSSSPSLSHGIWSFNARTGNYLLASKPKNDVSTIKFLPKTKNLEKDMEKRTVTFLKREMLLSERASDKPRSKKTPTSKTLRTLSTRGRLVSHKPNALRYKPKPHINKNTTRSLSHAEEINMLQMLSNSPLPYLNIHGHFHISKRIIRGYVRKGLLEETWGPKNVGILYKLTEKGLKRLQRLKKVTRLAVGKKEKISIRLKHRVGLQGSA